MQSKISDHQLHQIVDYIRKSYKTYGVQEKNGRRSFSLLEKGSDINLNLKKPILSFKKILLPNGFKTNTKNDEKIAFVGLNNCDVWALIAFLEEFSETSLMPSLDDILIIASQCVPNQFCFCNAMGTNKLAPFDLYLQDKKTHFEIFSGSEKGKKILEKNGVKPSSSRLTIDEIEAKDVLPLDKISKIIENREGNEKFWNALANTCFGCGACTAVCPLCFCTSQEVRNDLDGQTSFCLKWDACFAKRFSEIQNHYDLRPQNVDRLYNWYHHKFVRAKFERNHYLCTGCGRCIDACPANLNMKNILETLVRLTSKMSSRT